MASYKVGLESFHYQWSAAHKPVIRIASGDSISFDVNEVMSWQITQKSKAKDLARLDNAKLYPLSGPVYVSDASPGDDLRIIVEEIETANWGWSAIIPGLGLLPEFKKPYLWIWDLSGARKSGYVKFKNGIKVPYRPFCGVMGVAPKEPGEFPVMPPKLHGGNLDIRHLIEGSALDLPVWRRGALFSVGDMHAVQGDGEVCVTAIECPGKVKLKFELVKGAGIKSPRFTTPRTRGDNASEFSTVGIAPDLMEASKMAVRNMIEYLSNQYSLTREEAYVLCSVAADLRIHEVVDAPNWVVGLAISKSLLP